MKYMSKFRKNQLDGPLKIGRRLALFGEPYDYNNRGSNEKVLKSHMEEHLK